MDRDERVTALWEKDRITAVILAFGRALDRGDWALYRQCLADQLIVDFTRLTGQPEVRTTAELWTRFAELALTPVRRHHQYSNIAIAIDGAQAEATVYMVARHWKETDLGSSENTQYGWYDFRLARMDDGWKITHLRHMFQWISGNGALLDFADTELGQVMARIFAPENRTGR